VIADIAVIGKPRAFTKKDRKEHKGDRYRNHCHTILGGQYPKATAEGRLCSTILDGQFQIGTGLHRGVGRFEAGRGEWRQMIPWSLPVVPAFPKCSKMG
jgi:hypothetical protein